MAKIGVKVKQNPKLCQREISNGRTALYLEYYYGRTETPKLDSNGNPMTYPNGRIIYQVKHDRKKEELKLYIPTNPRTPEEREQRRETLILAEKIRQEREQERLQDVMGYRVNTHKDDNIMAFFETYLSDYSKKDLRNVRLAINRFKSFLREYRPECAIKKSPSEIEAIKQEWVERHHTIYGRHPLNENEFYRFVLKPGQLSKELVEHFAEYLTANSEGEGSATAFARFKRVVKAAYEKGLLRINPCEGVKCENGAETVEKDRLSQDEISKLVSTHYPGENSEIRKAFILSLYTGIRFCDIVDLTYNNVKYSTTTLEFIQSKTKRNSKAAKVAMPLRKDLLKMIGKPEEKGKSKNDKLFNLPSHTMCLKALRHWTKRAGIEKHITWHCARHSFATNILTNGASVVDVATLLGHSGLTYAMRYAKSTDQRKKAAVNGLAGTIEE